MEGWSRGPGSLAWKESGQIVISHNYGCTISSRKAIELRGSPSMQICNPSAESTQGRSHSSVKSVTSALDEVKVLDVTLGYTQEKNHLCVISAPRGSPNIQIANHTAESTQGRGHSSVSSATSAFELVAI